MKFTVNLGFSHSKNKQAHLKLLVPKRGPYANNRYNKKIPS